VLAALTDCNLICAGNSFEYCGAGNYLEMYRLTSLASSTSAGVSSSASSLGTGSAASSKTSSSVSSSISISTPLGTGFPAGWTYQGCFIDGINGRILNHQQADNQQNTLQSCVATCAAAGYDIAGTEYGVECYCDNFVYNGGSLAPTQSDCNVPCPGNTAEDCGAGNRLSMYSKGTPHIYAPPAAQASGLPAGWTYEGCLQ
jgi:hypothetical protein